MLYLRMSFHILSLVPKVAGYMTVTYICPRGQRQGHGLKNSPDARQEQKAPHPYHPRQADADLERPHLARVGRRVKDQVIGPYMKLIDNDRREQKLSCPLPQAPYAERGHDKDTAPDKSPYPKICKGHCQRECLHEGLPVQGESGADQVHHT